MYHFFPKLVLRTPAYTLDTYKEADLPQLLTDPYFQAAIYLASAVLYRELEKKQFALEALSPEMRVTLQKYLNRMCFRPTPFGLFAGVATAAWGEHDRMSVVLPSEEAGAAAALSYGEGIKLAEGLLAQELTAHHVYCSNTSRYRVADELRYLRYEHDTASGKRHYFVDAVERTGFLESLLSFCIAGKSREAVIQFSREALSASEAEAGAFFDQLVEQQLLLSTLEANITGENYLQRLLRACQSRHIDTPTVKHVQSLRDALSNVSGVTGKEAMGRAVLALDRAFPHLRKAKSPLYVNLDMGKAVGGLATSYQTSLLEGLECLHRLLPAQQPQGLQRFATAYSKKFEGRAMPLLVALDPELGVGYEALAAGYSSPVLLQGIGPAREKPVNPLLEWTPAHALMLEKWNGRTSTTAALRLDRQDVERLPAGSGSVKLPPTTSVLFRVKRDKVYIEQAGGASAAALLGRFTPISEEVAKLARDVAQQEQQANPHVLFAEIAHASDAHTANIDRRRNVRDFEIPVLVQSTLPLDRQIPLSDLWVRVEEGQVILFSEKLQKVIVPRLSSAFNYVRNDLAVFRFLCDLQYQGLQASFTLDLRDFFPGMRFYPRVVYKSSVLHLATWHLEKEQLASVLAASRKQGLQAVRQLAAEQGWPRHIALTAHDHQLVIDLQREADMTLFLEAIRNKEQVTVKEFPFVEEAAPAVADEAGRPYVHQFLAALYHAQEVYPPRKLEKPARGTGEARRKLLPGHDWLYFKLYCHPARSNRVLTEVVLPIVTRLQKQGAVQQWFYVRYRDPDYHLRVRLSVCPEQAGASMQAFSRKLSGPVRKRVIGDVQVAVYERELERYGPALIETVEAFFCASSALVAGSIKKHSVDETDLAYYQVGFAGLEAIAAALAGGLAEKEALLAGLYEGFYREFDGDRALREQLGAKYRAISRVGVLPLPQDALPADRALRKRWQRMQDTLREVGQAAAALSPDKRARLAADLMHMHLNRLFVDEPRKQELVTYYCLWRHYKSLRARGEA